MGPLHIIICALLVTTTLSFVLPVVQFLREGKEASTDVTHGLEQRYDSINQRKAKKFRFILHRITRDDPLFVYVTPCGGSVHWRLFSVSDDGSFLLKFPSRARFSSEVP